MRWRFSLFWVLFIPYLAVGVGASGVTFWVSRGHRAVMNRALATQAALDAGKRVAAALDKHRQDLTQLVALQQQQVQNTNPQDVGALRQTFVENLQLFPEVDGLFWVSAQGDFVQLYRQPEGGLALWRRQLPDRRLHRYVKDGQTFRWQEATADFDPQREPPVAPWYPEVQQKGALWRTMELPLGGPLPRERAWVWLAPVRDRPGRFLGVVAAALNQAHLSSSLGAHKASPHSRILVVDEQGQWVAAIKSPKSALDAAPTDLSPAIAPTDSLAVAVIAELSAREDSLIQDWRWENQRYVLHRQPLPQQHQLVVVVPHGDFDNLQEEVGWGLGQSLLTLVGTAMVGWVLARYLGRSLQRIEQAAQGLAQGQFAVDLPRHPLVEFQNVGELLQTVGQDLTAAVELSRNYTTELERAIAERTEKLAAAERFLVDLLNHLPWVMWLEDVHTSTLRYANTAYQEFANPQDLACSPEERKELQSGLVCEIERRLPSPQGEDSWWWIRRLPLRDREGNPTSILTVAEDITVRRRLEAAQQDCEMQFRHLAENIPGAIFRYVLYADGQEALTYISPRIFDLCEITPQAILEDLGCWWRLMPEEQVSSLRAAIAHSATHLTPLHQEFLVFLPSGQEKWLEVASRPFLGNSGEVFWDGVLMDVTDRHRHAEALRLSEERYRTLAESLPVGVFRCDAQGQTVYCNQTLLAILGATATGLTAEQWLAFVDERDRAAEAAGWQTFVAAVQQGRTTPWEVEYRYRSASGQLGWVWVRAIPERDRQGQLLGFLGSVMEITARKVLSDQLDRELGWRRAMEAAMVEGLAAIDLQGRQTYVSPALCRMVGWSAAELVGKMPPHVYWAPEDADRIQQILVNHIAAGIPLTAGVEVTFQKRDGQRLPVWMVSAPIYNEQGQVTGWLTSFYDLTARKALEQERETARDRYRLLFESINDGFAVLEVIFDDAQEPVDGCFWEANAALCRLVGQSELVGRRLSAWLPPMAEMDCNLLTLFAQVLATGESLRIEEEVKFLGQWFEFQIFPVEPRSENKVGILVRDIGDRKRWEAMQIAAKEAAEAADRAKTELVSKVTHDLRTPLNAILGLSELLMSEPNLTESQRNWLQTITQSGRYLLSLINDLLETAKLRAGKVTLRIETFRLRESIDEILSLLLPSLQQKGLEFYAEFDPNLPVQVRGDRQKWSRILTNLLNNAVKFTVQGYVRVRVHYAQHQLCLAVEDTGIGIPESQLTQVFENFTQADNTQGEGTGLGLAIAHQYAQLMGGKLWATSELGKGSTFWLQVPMPAIAEIPTVAVTQSPITKPWLRILVAEDNLVNQQVMQTMLQRLGYSATFVSDGREALAILLRQSFDLVFMDVDMPKMDGIAATTEIYRTLPFERQPPIVGITALIEQRDRCLRAGMFDVLPKPIRLDDLVKALQQCSPHTPLPDPEGENPAAPTTHELDKV
ncbi:MAG: PAS domain S-box protein [Pseudanabaenaceae cyanobacterium]